MCVWSCFPVCFGVVDTQPLPHAVDETHFGKFTAHYLTGEYYFDMWVLSVRHALCAAHVLYTVLCSHPPLAKLTFWLVARLSGYDQRCIMRSNVDRYLETAHFFSRLQRLRLRGHHEVLRACVPVLHPPRRLRVLLDADVPRHVPRGAPAG